MAISLKELKANAEKYTNRELGRNLVFQAELASRLARSTASLERESSKNSIGQNIVQRAVEPYQRILKQHFKELEAQFVQGEFTKNKETLANAVKDLKAVQEKKALQDGTTLLGILKTLRLYRELDVVKTHRHKLSERETFWFKTITFWLDNGLFNVKEKTEFFQEHQHAKLEEFLKYVNELRWMRDAFKERREVLPRLRSESERFPQTLTVKKYHHEF